MAVRRETNKYIDITITISIYIYIYTYIYVGACEEKANPFTVLVCGGGNAAQVAKPT